MSAIEDAIDVYIEVKHALKQAQKLQPNDEEVIDFPTPIEIGTGGKQFYITGVQVKRGGK